MSSAAQSEKTIFLEAAEIVVPAERAAFLDQACAGNPQLRAAVEALLASHQRPHELFDVTAAGLNQIPGSQIGPYKLLQQIGEGGMGVVWMAEQHEPVRRKVAVKIIKPGMDTRQVVARFEAERQALSLMDHPNIAKVLDAGTTESGRPYFVMELVKGQPITQYCDEHHLTPRQRLELLLPVCQAIQHAHQKGIIHRDIKPTNILVAEYDQKAVPKVIDFGVAKATSQALTEKTMFTGFGQIVGTLEYMSPEQAKANQLDIDTRSDIYSLGVLLYELLTGSTPFDKQRLRSAAWDEMLRIIREEEPEKPSTRLSSVGSTHQTPLPVGEGGRRPGEGTAPAHNPQPSLASIAAVRSTEPARLTKLVRGELDWIVMKALEKDRSRRYETASGFAADIQHYLNDEAVVACPPSAGYRFRKFARRNKAAFTTAAMIAVALLVGTVISTWQAIRASRAEVLALTRFEAEQKARGRAAAEAANANAISALLQEALQSANPDHAKGADYTVRQLLDDLSQGMGDQLKDQPEVEATIRATIGNAYRRLFLMDVAEPHLERALAIRRKLATGGGNANHEQEALARSLHDYGWNLMESTRFLDAERCLREALAIYKANHVRDARVIDALSTLQMTVDGKGRLEDAVAVANEAMALGRELFPEGHAELANVLHRLAGEKQALRDLPAAEALAHDAVRMHARWHGDKHPETGWAYFTLAKVQSDVGRHAEAEASHRRALSIFRAQYGDTHAVVTSVLAELQRALKANGNEAGLAELRAEQKARLLKAIERDPSDLGTRTQLGFFLQQTGDLDGALAQFSEVIARNSTLLDAWTARGDCYRRRGEFANAADDFSAAIKLNPDRSDAWTHRAALHFHLQRWNEAVSDYSNAIELAPQIHTNWYHRGNAYLALAQWDKAAEDFTKVVDGWPHESGGWYLRGLAYAQLNQPDKAIADLGQAIAKGFKDVERMTNDPMLEPLRSNDNFKKLLTTFENDEQME